MKGHSGRGTEKWSGGGEARFGGQRSGNGEEVVKIEETEMDGLVNRRCRDW